MAETGGLEVAYGDRQRQQGVSARAMEGIVKQCSLTRTAVIRSHREQWRTLVDRVEMVKDELASGETDVIKALKVYAETLKIIHDGERRAWGIDEAALRPARRATLELRCGDELVELSAQGIQNEQDADGVTE